ncbi:MAG: 2-oxo-4-hydroxy-4-carboxy-5-ureidoimidazoline decarboxylase [Leptolyngbyaceae cyanobacterium]
MDSPQPSFAQLNQMSQTDFVAVLGEVWEATPAIAAAAWHYRPFFDLDALHACMVNVVHRMSEAEQLRLICAHPDLGCKTRMAAASVKEQAAAGLDRLSPMEYDRFLKLNQAYRDKFGVPFIIAVKAYTKASILQAFEQRLANSPAAEMERALSEIAQIAQLRLEALMASE